MEGLAMKDISLKTDEYLPLREVVFHTLREAILTGELKPGEHLMEVKLANKLGVSRTPIREAIRKLELEGLVVMTPRRSAEVAKITKEDLVDVLEVRRVLESLAMELSCKNRTGQDIALLNENLQSFRVCIKENNLTDIAVTDVQFHEIIYKSTGNKRLNQILYNLREQMYRYRLEYIKDKETRHNLILEHEEIIKAIEERDVQKAKEAILLHINNQEQTILVNLEKAN
jgi:DNA-binding GntR family transcriptional regulator